MRRSEGRLQFEFLTALSVDQPERAADPFKCVDFLVEEVDATWMIEVTEAARAPGGERPAAIKGLLAQLQSGILKKDMLMKLYGTHAHLADNLQTPNQKVFFCVIVGLPPRLADAAQRNRMRDEMKRVTDRIGPSFFGTANRPILKVETIESWNATHPSVTVS